MVLQSVDAAVRDTQFLTAQGHSTDRADALSELQQEAERLQAQQLPATGLPADTELRRPPAEVALVAQSAAAAAAVKLQQVVLGRWL